MLCWTPGASAQQTVPTPQPPGQTQPPTAESLRRERQDDPRVPLIPKDQDLDEEARFEPPTRDELFRLESESSYLQRLKLQRRAARKLEPEIPEERHITGVLPVRSFLPMQATLFPAYVVYHPLYFQQINAERYGWELGVFQPLISMGQFYGDVALLPYKAATTPPWLCESNVGYALPGDPEPLRFLTVPFSWRGVAAEAGVAVGGAAIFP